MPLVAMRGDERVDATKHTAETWEDVRAASKRRELTMPLCGVRAVAKVRGESTRFFAHYRGQGCRADHGEESPQHLAMKDALARAIDAVPGWHAIIEYPHPSREWIIDVLAESDTPVKRRVAFEVQLSSQTHTRYFERSSRYFASGIFPVWMIPRPLEKHSIKVPTVVTWFGKDRPVPEDVGELLLLAVDQNGAAHAPSSARLDEFVAALLTMGPAWTLGTPGQQAARREKEARARAQRRLYEARAREERSLAAARERERMARAVEDRKSAEAARIEAMNRSCTSPASVYGQVTVPIPGDAFVFATLAGCSRCPGRMLLWWTCSPGWGKQWSRTPSTPGLKVDLRHDRPEDWPRTRRGVDTWAAAVGCEEPKALILLATGPYSRRTYAAFVCPTCKAVFEEYYMARIRDEHWSVIAAPELETAAPRGPL